MRQVFGNSKTADNSNPEIAGGRASHVLLAITLLAFSLGACQVPTAALVGNANAGKAKIGSPAPSGNGSASAVLSDPVFATSLVGLPDERVAEVFGKPRQVRKEAPAEVWQYAGENCVVDFYLYRIEGGGLSVSYVEARDAAAVETAPESCFGALLQRASL